MPLTLQPESSWNTWDFDRDLTVQFSQPIPTDDFTAGRREVTREGLQTLLLNNLEALFPDWKLRRLAGCVDPTGEQPLEAVDPAGVLHRFELRDVIDAPTAISDMLAGAMQRIDARQLHWFSRQHRPFSRWLAARNGAFWLDVTADADAVTAFDDLDTDEARDKKLTYLLDRLHDARSIDDATGAADAILENWTVDDIEAMRWPDHPAGVHLHLIVADATELDGGEVQLLQRMRNRGLRIDIWELALDADADRRKGTVAIRPARFPDRRQKSFDALDGHRPTELLAHMAYDRPDLYHDNPGWELVRNKRRTTLRTELPIADEPCRGPFFGFTTRGDTIEFKASLKVPEHLDEAYSMTDLKTRVTPLSMRAVRNWVADVLPPDPTEDREAARRLEHFMHQTKKWGGYLQMSAIGPVMLAKGWHSGGLRSATVTVDTSEMEPSLDELAALTNELFESFMQHLIAEDARPVGWEI